MIKSLLIYFIVAIIGFAVVDFYSLSNWIVIIFMVVAFTFMLTEMFYISYGTTNMKKVEKFLRSKPKEPIYAFVYAQANSKSKEELIKIIEEIVNKYPQKYIKHNYQFVREMLDENYDAALIEAEHIEKEPFMSYSKALVYATKGDKKQALSYQLSKEWMREAILATLAKKENNQQAYHLHRNKAIKAARGIQRFGLIHTL